MRVVLFNRRRDARQTRVGPSSPLARWSAAQPRAKPAEVGRQISALGVGPLHDLALGTTKSRSPAVPTTLIAFKVTPATLGLAVVLGAAFS